MIFKRLCRWLRSEKASPGGAEKTIQVSSTSIFRLVYEKNEIGTLEFSDNQWRFVYSEWFKNQAELKPFANFPEVSREYISDDLPPFFESRLPGVSQPQVEAFLRGKVQVSNGETKAALLKEFGRRAITNPFELMPAI